MRVLTTIALIGLFSPLAVIFVGTAWPSAFSGYETAIRAIVIAMAVATPCAVFLLFRSFQWILRYFKSSSHSSSIPKKISPGLKHFNFPE